MKKRVGMHLICYPTDSCLCTFSSCHVYCDLTGDGQVHVLFKDTTFEDKAQKLIASWKKGPQITKCCSCALAGARPSVDICYSVKVMLIAVFKLDLDYLCASRTAPHHSFLNPTERIMSVLNLGMQSVRLARRQLEEEVEHRDPKVHNQVTDQRASAD